MKRHFRMLTVLPMAVAVLLLWVAAPAIWAGDHDDEDEIPFDEAEVFFELNHTDGDLGIHALIDGEAWKMLTIGPPEGKEILKIRLKGQLRRQGLTELFFESAEPTFDELSPEAFFRRFPEGEYEIEGKTIEGDELESTVIVTHLLPAPVESLKVNGVPVPEDCDDGPVPEVMEPFLITLDPVTHSHPDLGRTDEPIVVVRYQLVVEREEPVPLNFSIELPPGVTAVELPAGLASSGEEFKVEVLVREAGGNQTAVESCFEVL